MNFEKTIRETVDTLLREDMCRNCIEKNIGHFADFVRDRLNKDTFVTEAHALQPFSGNIQDTIGFYYKDETAVVIMGFSIMRMDIDPDIYTFGLCLTVEDKDYQFSRSAIRFVTACQTIEDLRSLSSSDDFQESAKENFLLALKDCLGNDNEKEQGNNIHIQKEL